MVAVHPMGIAAEDVAVMTYSGSGTVTAPVQAVDTTAEEGAVVKTDDLAKAQGIPPQFLVEQLGTAATAERADVLAHPRAGVGGVARTTHQLADGIGHVGHGDRVAHRKGPVGGDVAVAQRIWNNAAEPAAQPDGQPPGLRLAHEVMAAPGYRWVAGFCRRCVGRVPRRGGGNAAAVARLHVNRR